MNEKHYLAPSGMLTAVERAIKEKVGVLPLATEGFIAQAACKAMSACVFAGCDWNICVHLNVFHDVFAD
jgi:hypothetical protein